MMLFVKSAYTTAVSFSFKRVPPVLSAPISIRRIPRWPFLAVALVVFWLLLAITMVAIGVVALAILAAFSFVIIMLAYAYQNHR